MDQLELMYHQLKLMYISKSRFLQKTYSALIWSDHIWSALIWSALIMGARASSAHIGADQIRADKVSGETVYRENSELRSTRSFGFL